MRKFATLITALALMVSVCTTAYATDGTHVDVGSGSDYTGEIMVGCRMYSEYTISIPFELQESEAGDIVIRNANMESGYHLAVYATNLDDDGHVSVYTTTPSGEEHEEKVMLFVEGEQVTAENDGLLCEFTSE